MHLKFLCSVVNRQVLLALIFNGEAQLLNLLAACTVGIKPVDSSFAATHFTP